MSQSSPAVNGSRVEHRAAGVSAFTQPEPAALGHAGVVPHQTDPAHPQVSAAAAAADGANRSEQQRARTPSRSVLSLSLSQTDRQKNKKR